MRASVVAVSLSVFLSFVAGCGGSPGLTVAGSVTIEVEGASTGFRFEQPTRLDGTAPAGAITGNCTLTSDGTGTAYGVLVELFGSAHGQGRAVRSVTVLARTDAPAMGIVEAELGPDAFRGTCDVEVPLVEGSGRVRVVSRTCTVSGPGETARVELDLTLERCTVMAR